MEQALITPESARWIAKQLFLESFPENGTWFDLAWDSSLKGPVAPREVTLSSQLPGLGAGSTVGNITPQMARNFAMLAETFIILSPTAGKELARRLVQAAGRHKLANAFVSRLTERATKCIDASADLWAVWACGPDDVVSLQPQDLSPFEFEAQFWNRREGYDLFVRDHSVFLTNLKGSPQVAFAREEHFRLLVAFLRYRGTPLGSRSLYLCAFRQKCVVGLRAEQDLVRDYLKPAVSVVRTAIRCRVRAFDIPRKPQTSGYRCVGRFSFCLALPAGAVPLFTVVSDLADGASAPETHAPKP